MDVLTNQENKIAALVAADLPEKQIADRLHIAPSTVHKHTANIRKKLGVKTAVGIAVKYIQSLEYPKQFVLACMFLVVQLFAIGTDNDQMRMFRSARSCRSRIVKKA